MTLTFNWRSNLVPAAVRTLSSARLQLSGLTSSLDNRGPLSSSATRQQPTFTSLFQRMSVCVEVWSLPASEEKCCYSFLLLQHSSVSLYWAASRGRIIIHISLSSVAAPPPGNKSVVLWFYSSFEGGKATVTVILLEIFSNASLIYLHVAPVDDTQAAWCILMSNNHHTHSVLYVKSEVLVLYISYI